MKRNTLNWSNFGMLLRRAGLTASAGLSCYLRHCVYTVVGTEYQTYVFGFCLLLIIDTVVFLPMAFEQINC